jgi:hypothetical protein
LNLLLVPAWDLDFHRTDLPMMRRMADIPARDRKHWPGPGCGGQGEGDG